MPRAGEFPRGPSPLSANVNLCRNRVDQAVSSATSPAGTRGRPKKKPERKSTQARPRNGVAVACRSGPSVLRSSQASRPLSASPGTSWCCKRCGVSALCGDAATRFIGASPGWLDGTRLEAPGTLGTAPRLARSAATRGIGPSADRCDRATAQPAERARGSVICSSEPLSSGVPVVVASNRAGRSPRLG